MGIFPVAQNTQYAIHRPPEAQEEGKKIVETSVLLKRGNIKPMERYTENMIESETE